MANLKDALTKKDEEMSQLRLRKSSSGEKGSPPYDSWSSRHSIGEFHNGTQPHGKSVGPNCSKAASDIDNCSEFSDKQSETSDEFRHHPDFFKQSKLVTEDGDQENDDDLEIIGLGDADSDERLSDISDGVLSMGTETDGSLSNSIVELTLFPETTKAPTEQQEK